jgi:glycosyltransferase involved in cell wall biosynthesis
VTVSTIRVIADQLLAPVPGGIGRYTEELTRELIRTAPTGSEVHAVVSASARGEFDRVRALLPGVAHLIATPLARRELSLAWQFGLLPLRGAGPIHAPSLLAPLVPRSRRRSDSKTVVTIHDVVPWTHPGTLTARGVTWHRAMATRAQRFADAVVVPTHAVAAELAAILDFDDRIRVIGGAASPKLSAPDDSDERARRLNLPDRYILSVGTLEPRKGLSPLIASLAAAGDSGLPLLIAGPAGWGTLDVATLAAEAGLPADRVRTLGYVSDADLATVMQRATVFVFPSLAEGFGLPLLEAFSLDTPVVHSDAPALVEVGGGAGSVVALTPADTYPERLAGAISAVVNDPGAADRMRVAGRLRATEYSWRTSAERVWQLHNEL